MLKDKISKEDFVKYIEQSQEVIKLVHKVYEASGRTIDIINLEDELNYAITKTEHLNDSIDNIIRIVNTTKEDKQHKEYTDSLYWSQRLSKKEEDEMNELMKSL